MVQDAGLLLKKENGVEDDNVRLSWSLNSSQKTWSEKKIQSAYKLILDTTGEAYSLDRLRMLPLATDFGNWVLQEKDGGAEIKGLLWVMKISDFTCRVLVFSVNSLLQRKGFGTAAWSLFSKKALDLGFESVQLEVRVDNLQAISMYMHWGLKPVGVITKYYRDSDAWLMQGLLRSTERQNDALSRPRPPHAR